jgi:AcrR family transcriptional regulator
MSDAARNVKEQGDHDAAPLSLYESFGRIDQKRRTRAAIKAAAAQLIASDTTPSMADIAQTAGVSRSSAYRYFPSVDALLAEVALDAAVAPDIATIDAAATTPGQPHERLAAVVGTDHRVVARHDAPFRAALRTMLAAETALDRLPRRPGNRLRYLTASIDDIKQQLPAPEFARLVAALALIVGIEARIVLSDIVALDDDEAEAVKQWMAATLLDATLAHADQHP